MKTIQKLSKMSGGNFLNFFPGTAVNDNWENLLTIVSLRRMRLDSLK